MKAIIFDFGNVIINIDVPRTFEAFSRLSGKSPQRIKSLFEQFQLFKRYESGMFNDLEFREIVRQIVGFPFNDAEIDEAWNALLLDIPDERIELIKQLSLRYPIYLLSNTNNIHIEESNKLFQRQFGIKTVKSLFTAAFYSYEIGLWKPDIAIYRYILKEINLNANEVIFLDDNFDNIHAAKSLGIESYLVTKEQDILYHLNKFL